MTTTVEPRPDVTPPSASAPSQRAGGLASLVIAATYVVGFVGMGAYLVPAGYTDALTDPATSVAFVLDHRVSLHLWYLLLYLVGGVALVVLALAVHERVTVSLPGLARVTTGFGLIWAGHLLASGMVALLAQQAVVELADHDPELARTTWVTLSVVQDALGGGIELVGAAWLLLVSVAALRVRMLGRGLAVLGLVVGVAGLVTLVPVAAEAAMSVFGLGLVVWFVGAGVAMTRR